MFILSQDQPSELTEYLKARNWLESNEHITALSRPGEGNMNYVLRVDTGSRTMIIKQSRDYVEKYPQIAAPADRIVTEGAFYLQISSVPMLKSLMPKILGLDTANHILLLEDLGATSDFSVLYRKNTLLEKDDLITLVEYLNMLHQSFYLPDGNNSFANEKMKILNYEHIFCYPFLEENGFNLDNVTLGLQEYAMKFKQDQVFKKLVKKIGKLYLSQGDYLIHGDYYPGSWLKSASGIKIIDPEFCFYGPREFDLAVLKAHLILSQHDRNFLKILDIHYNQMDTLDKYLLYSFTGIEIMRRLIGLAQLPLKLDLEVKKQLLEKAYNMLKQEKYED